MSLFVDASVWYAAADAGDASNRRAKAVLKAGESLVTTDHVLVETCTLLRHRMGRLAAERFWDGMRSGVAMLEPVGVADLEAAWQIGHGVERPGFFAGRSDQFCGHAPAGDRAGGVPR